MFADQDNDPAPSGGDEEIRGVRRGFRAISGVKSIRRRKRRKRTRPRFRKGIHILPGLLTVSNIFCGFLAIISTMHCLGIASGSAPPWSLSLSTLLIAFAIVLDGLDGRVARFTGTTSQFGLELDSLADMISFGLAPALIFYAWALEPLGRLGWLAAFFYVVCCAARLARFNVKVETATSDPAYFVGMPSPAAAAVLASMVFFRPTPTDSTAFSLTMMSLCLLVAFLMVSKFRYHSFKKVSRGRRSYIFVVFAGLALVAIAAAPEICLLVIASAYAMSGPLQKVLALPAVQRRQAQRFTSPGGTDGATGAEDEGEKDHAKQA